MMRPMLSDTLAPVESSALTSTNGAAPKGWGMETVPVPAVC